MASTRTLLSRLTVAKSDEPRQRVVAEKEVFRPSESIFDANDWKVFVPASAMNISRVDLVFYEQKNGFYKGKWETIPFADHTAVGFAVSEKYFGEGAERIVYKMTELDAKTHAVGPALVAKESLFKQKKQDARYLEK